MLRAYTYSMFNEANGESNTHSAHVQVRSYVRSPRPSLLPSSPSAAKMKVESTRMNSKLKQIVSWTLVVASGKRKENEKHVI